MTSTVKRPSSRPRISARELEILNLVAKGRSSKEIAVILSISSRTVDVHSKSLIRKLAAANRVHAVVIAIRDGVIAA